MSHLKVQLIAILVIVTNFEERICVPPARLNTTLLDLSDENDFDGSDEDDGFMETTCLTDNDTPYTFFGTKTTYLHPEIGNKNTVLIQLPGI